MAHGATRPTALVHDVESDPGGSITRELRHMGWQVRTAGVDLHAWMTVPADLWAVDLGRLDPDPLAFLDTLSELPSASPLLVVADIEQIGSYGHELVHLLSRWCHPADFVIRPVRRAELPFRVLRLTLYQSQQGKPMAIREFGALRIDMGRHDVFGDERRDVLGR